MKFTLEINIDLDKWLAVKGGNRQALAESAEEFCDELLAFLNRHPFVEASENATRCSILQ